MSKKLILKSVCNYIAKLVIWTGFRAAINCR